MVVLVAAGCNLVRGPAPDGECRGNLRSIIGGELNFFQTRQRYSMHPAEVGFAPAPGNRYLYLFDAAGAPVTRREDGVASAPLAEVVGVGPDTRTRGVTAEALLARFPPDIRAGLGIRGQCPACSITVGCVGNIDDDDAVDVWTVSSEDRTIDGRTVPRGTPHRHRNDREAR